MRPDGVLRLVRKAREGPDSPDSPTNSAWNELFRRAQPDLLHLAAQSLPAHWRGDSVSVVLGRVWEKGRAGIVHLHGADTAQDDAEAVRLLLAWLRAVVNSAVFDYLKEVSRQPGSTVPLTGHAPEGAKSSANGVVPNDPSVSGLTQLADAEESARRQAESVRLEKALAALPEADRALLLRMFSGEESLRGIARSMRLNDKTLRERRERILKRLRKEMEAVTHERP